jgi:Protein of unknown function (DUF3071)
MRSLRVVGLGEDGKIVICEDPARGERFQIPADERLRAAARGDITRLGQIAIELESQMRPREIQSRIRAGESVEQVAAAAGVPASRVERFAYPVLLERSRTAELAQRAHPIREDGPDLQELGEVVAQAFAARGQDYTQATWDSWKGEDGKWVIQLTWTVGRSHIRAHWSFHPGAHGGTVTPLDDHAIDLLDPNPNRQLRTVRPVTELAAQALQVERPPLEQVERRQVVGGDDPPLRSASDDSEHRTEQEFVQDIELTDDQDPQDGFTTPEPPAPEPRKPSPTPRNPPRQAATPRQTRPPEVQAHPTEPEPAAAPHPAQPEPPQPTKHEPAQHEPAQPEPAQHERAQHEPAQREPAQREPAQREPAQHEPAQREPAQREPAQREPAQHEPAQREPAPREPAQREPAQHEPAQREPAPNRPAQREHPQPQPAQPSPSEPAPSQPASPAAAAPREEPQPAPPPVQEPAATQDPPAAAPPRQPAATTQDPAPEPESPQEPDPKAAPEPPAAAEPPKPAPAKPRKGKKGRPIVPSWEDVLLGTRSNR